MARLEGKVDALMAKLDGQIAKLSDSIEYGDRSNAQAISFVDAEVKRAHTRIDAITDPENGELARRDDRIAANRRLVWTSLIGPIVTALVIALLLYSIGLK
jgi:hypothetical protein